MTTGKQKAPRGVSLRRAFDGARADVVQRLVAAVTAATAVTAAAVTAAAAAWRRAAAADSAWGNAAAAGVATRASIAVADRTAEAADADEAEVRR